VPAPAARSNSLIVSCDSCAKIPLGQNNPARFSHKYSLYRRPGAIRVIHHLSVSQGQNMFIETSVEWYADRLRQGDCSTAAPEALERAPVSTRTGPAVTVRIATPPHSVTCCVRRSPSSAKRTSKAICRSKPDTRRSCAVAEGLVLGRACAIAAMAESATGNEPFAQAGCRAIEYHYDVSNDFYRLWLDRNMALFLRYFKDAGDSSKPLRSRSSTTSAANCSSPGERFLDIAAAGEG